MNLSAGSLALINITYLVVDDDLAIEDLLIGLPVIQHLGIENKTPLEELQDVLLT